MKKSNSLAQSVTSKLSLLARSQKKPFDKLLTIFLLERMVARLIADKVLARCLVFKGGYVSIRVYDSQRFTTDVDVVISGLDRQQAIKMVKVQMALPIPDATWFEFENEQELNTQNEYGGWRLTYRAGLGDQPEIVNRSQLIHIDLGICDAITPGPLAIETEGLLGDETLSWQVYPVETIIAEKLHALLSRGSGNSRARDIYDLSTLLPKADRDKLNLALQATFFYRKTPLPQDIADELEAIDTTLLEKGWRTATSHIAGAKDFTVFYDAIRSWFKR
jgi:predicted nucleotidyltransferase component of viral defense system